MQRIALISDIHGNMPALEAALDDIARRGIGRIYCLGDLEGRGPPGPAVIEGDETAIHTAFAATIIRVPNDIEQAIQDAIDAGLPGMERTCARDDLPVRPRGSPVPDLFAAQEWLARTQQRWISYPTIEVGFHSVQGFCHIYGHGNDCPAQPRNPAGADVRAGA